MPDFAIVVGLRSLIAAPLLGVLLSTFALVVLKSWDRWLIGADVLTRMLVLPISSLLARDVLLLRAVVVTLDRELCLPFLVAGVCDLRWSLVEA